MNEVEWLACTEVWKLLDFLEGKMSERKFRLFACACCRMMRLFPGAITNGQALEISERYADGQSTKGELKAARQKSSGCVMAATRLDCFAAAREAITATYDVVRQAADPTGYSSWYYFDTPTTQRLVAEQSREQCCIFRELVGPVLFRGLPLDSTWLAWNDRTVIRIAQAIYDERAYDRMPILADALEDAGCDNADILNHCRQPGEHVRGCWVVDLILGKS